MDFKFCKFCSILGKNTSEGNKTLQPRPTKMITGTLNQQSVHVGIWQSQPGKSEEFPFQTSEGCYCVEFLIQEMSTALDKLSALLQNSSFIVAGFTASS